MAEVPLEAGKPELWVKIFDWLTAGANFDNWPGILKWGLILLFGIFLLIWVVGFLLQSFAKALEAYKNSGYSFMLRGEKRAQVRRRQQFCEVLKSDLLTIAKAEHWNDQYFTDLEAEVEAEGDYYTSLLHKMLGLQSHGLRRVSSLISAIEFSAEQALLIVGQPGSGKSVALRHLGHQLAVRGIRSADTKTTIPLYVNLRELTSVPNGSVNADYIKQFVLDNIRRGDADTVAYAHEHWDEYRTQGIWFFLFDSFDEIPAVLHAPTGSTVIAQHAEAIRQFLNGMSSCHGVLASREFRGPDALPWQKIRILPLSEERQTLLIKNSFLETKDKEIVKQHLVSGNSSLRNNPLFLTLLCRYVKDHNHPPINDHDLLSGHIDRLAQRDEDYTIRKYGLTPGQLIEGAIKIAVLFAERPTLSLAPTQTEIAAEFQQNSIPGGSLENLLGALVDVKIGRTDVQEARAGDRRFTFSHRRYQETLFVRHLARTNNYISPRELLTDMRWREYSVTLLQTQEVAVIEPLLTEATKLLAEYSRYTAGVPIIPEFGGHLTYYDWHDDPAVPLLTLLQEGLARRMSEVPPNLSLQIGNLLSPRWEDGDLYDQTMVLRLGGLLPQSVLATYLAYAVNHGGLGMEDIAFERVVFLKEVPDTLANWVRDRLSREALNARTQVNVLRLEALSARLPSSLGTIFILQRCQIIQKLRRPLKVFNLMNLFTSRNPRNYMREIFFEIFFPAYMFFGVVVMSQIALSQHRVKMPTFVGPDVLPFLYDYLNFWKQILNQSVSILLEYSYLFACLGFAYVTGSAMLLILYNNRSAGSKLNVTYLFRRVGSICSVAKIIKVIRALIIFIGASTLVLCSPGALAHGIAWMLGYRNVGVDLYIVAFLVAIFVLVIGIIIHEHYDKRRLITRIQNFQRQGLGLSLVLQIQSYPEFQCWLDNDDNLLRQDVTATRSLLRLLRPPLIYQAGHPIFGSPVFKVSWDEISINRVLSQLLIRLNS
ncbi:MAG: NACHT domain-containing protein [Methylococcaceae bacterium]